MLVRATATWIMQLGTDAVPLSNRYAALPT
jgi:hypothetical protein